MTEFEHRQIGNMSLDDLYSSNHYNEIETTTASIAQDWRAQGITFEVTDPVPTTAYSSEQLRAMGLVGITLVIPKPEQSL